MTDATTSPLPAAASYESCSCAYFSSSTCSSCPHLGLPSGKRLQAKITALQQTFASFQLPPERLRHDMVIPAHPWGSRNKAKLSIAGTINQPIIGMVRSDQSCVDLRRCPLMAPPLERFCADLPDIIKAAALIPYDIKARTGELKGVIIIVNHDHSQGIVRFVLRSTEAVQRIGKTVSLMQTRHPWANVISCNIQPLPAAVLEGPDEVLLTPQRFMRERYGPVTLLCAPQSFIQVTHEVAAQLYQAAAKHVQENQFSSALDLFCGIGGFSYAVAPYVQNITGVELSTAAIESARAAATFNGPAQPLFFAADADTFNLAEVTPQPELVIVNPPRRGLSSDILQRLMQLAPRSILYSSCNPATFARDVRILLDSGGYTLDAAQPFDMFPLTHHCEVLGTLSR